MKAARHPQHRPRWQLAVLAALLPLVLLLAVDVGLRAAGLVPPDDPILFHARSHEQAFSPFVDDRRGQVRIRRDWVNPGNGLRGVAGRRAGRVFLYPGFRPARFAREKPAATLRVFALGGSTTFGTYVGAEAAFPEVLEQELAALAPGRSVEVINLGCAGWASDRVANLVPRLLAFAPDLLIVYSGHNEMLVGDVGAGPALGPAARLRVALLRSSALFAWLDHALASTLRAAETEVLREEALALEAGNALTFDPWNVPPAERRPPDDGFLARAAAAYAGNLTAIAEACEAAGVPLLLALPISNLLYPPVIGAARADAARFEAAMEAGSAALAEGRSRRAARRFEEALALAPRHARAHHQLGLALLDTQPERARAELERARDLDVRTHRMPGLLEETLIGVAEARGVPWVDLRPVFHERLDLASSRRLFLDHVHPTAYGHGRIADALLPSAARLLGLADPGAGNPPPDLGPGAALSGTSRSPAGASR